METNGSNQKFTGQTIDLIVENDSKEGTLSAALPPDNNPWDIATYKINENTGVEDLLRQSYNVAMTNCVISIDITFIRGNIALLILCDVATRKVIGYCLKETPFAVKDIVDTLTFVIQSRRNFPKILVVHSDCDHLFAHKDVQALFEDENIAHSRVRGKQCGNQVSERLNQTIKSILKKKVAQHFHLPISRKSNPLKDYCYSIDQLSNWVSETVHQYNEKKHDTLRKLSPNEVEAALLFHFNKYKGQVVINSNNKLAYKWRNSGPEGPESTIVDAEVVQESEIDLVSKNNTDGGEVVKNFLQHTFAGAESPVIENATKFFFEWRAEAVESNKFLTKEVLNTRNQLDVVVRLHLEEQQKNAILREQMQALYVSNQEEVERKKQKEIEKEKRQQAKSNPRRDIISKSEFAQLLEAIPGKSPLKKARICLALILLYQTGLRISNLLNLEVRHFMELKTKGETFIPLIKGGAKDKMILLSQEGKQLLLENEKTFQPIVQNKDYFNPLFSSKKDTAKPLGREALNRDINGFLKSSTLAQFKFVRSHSFRRSFITDCLMDNDPHHVATVVGHRSIEATLVYDAYQMRGQDYKAVIDRMEKRRKLDSKKDTEKDL